MSVVSENNRTAELTTDGAETEFDFSMLIHADTEIEVWYEVSGDSYTQLTLATHYTVVFTEDGGTVTTIGDNSPYAAGKILIIRHLPITQLTNWLYNDNHTERQHQDDFDRSVMRDLQIQEQLDRCVGFAIHSDTKDIEFPEPEANEIIGWNAAGDALENKSPSALVVSMDLDDLSDVDATPNDDSIIVGNGTIWVEESGVTARASLGLTIGTNVLAEQTIGIADDNLLEVDGTPNSGEYARFTANGLEGRTLAEFVGDFSLEIGVDVQAWDTQLDDIAALAVTNGNFIVGDGSNWIVESGDTARTSLGVGTGDSPTLTGLTITGNSVFGLNSSVFQPTTDTTFFQVKDAAGTSFLIGDSTNKFWEMIRETATTDADVNVLKLTAKSTGVMANYFGPSIDFYIKDADADNKIASIFAVRRVNDAGGRLQFSVVNRFGVVRVDTYISETGQLVAGSDILVGQYIFHNGDSDTFLQFTPNKIQFDAGGTDILTLNGNIGLFEIAPETAVELTHATPYITLHNSTHEDTDGGGEVRIIGKREDGAGTETAAGQIEISHDGAGVNDQLGKIVEYVNTGSGLVAARKIDSSTNWVINKTSGVGIKVDITAPTFGWADLQAEPSGINTGASKPTQATYRDTLKQFQFAAGDEEYYEYHIPHDYVPGTDVHVHVHWSHTGTFVSGGTITFTVESTYSKGHNQAPFPASVSGDFNGTASTTQYQHIVSETQLSASTPAGLQIDTDDLEPDGIIIMRVLVKTNDMTVSEGAVPDPFIHHVDIHYQTTGLIGTKQKAPDFYT